LRETLTDKALQCDTCISIDAGCKVLNRDLMSSSASTTATHELPDPEVASGRPTTAASHTEAASDVLSCDPSTDIAGALADLQLELQTAFAQRNAAYAERDTAVAERERLRVELNVRNCALDATKSHFMILDMKRPGSPIIYINRAMAAAHGYEPAELLGQSAKLLVATEHSKPEVRAIDDAMRTGTSVRTDLRARRKDGSCFHAGIFVGPVQNAHGDVTHYVAVGADITARLEEEANRRRLQEQLVNEMRERERMASELRLAHKLEAVGQLAAGIAHEINTPVQYVGDSVYFLQSAARDLEGLLQIYRREIDALPPGGALSAACERLRHAEARADLDFLRDEVPKAIERALDGIGRVTHIVRAIKEFAHPDGHEQKAADINHAIETTLTVTRNEYKYCATVVPQLGALPEVICNVGELNQVLVNLIVNAAHAIQESGKDAATGRITITTAVDGDAVLIRVADNGCGIPGPNLERIFDPFFTTKEVGKGTGQGLSIARSIIVERHGGRIGVTSEVGLGTEFTVHLPIVGRGGAPAS
jgi:PAS domain S-box-containing protein